MGRGGDREAIVHCFRLAARLYPYRLRDWTVAGGATFGCGEFQSGRRVVASRK